MTTPRILIVDDEPAIVTTVQAYLVAEGYSVTTAMDGLSALRVARINHPDLVILDLMLPGLDGLDVLRRLRQESPVYVLVLTAKAGEADKIVGLTLGADDYLTKPFSPGELVARVKAILRRGRDPGGEPALVFQHVRIDPEARQVWKDGTPVPLTAIEFDLLHVLARHRGRLRSRDQLIEQLWGYDYYGDERVIDVHIGRLRKKLEDNLDQPTLLVTVRGAGYRFEDTPA